MTNDEGSIDLAQLIKTMLEVRECALIIAVDGRNGDLAAAVTDGDDCLVHDLLIAHVVCAKEEAENADADARKKLNVEDGRVPVHGLSDLFNVLSITSEICELREYATMVSQLCDLAADTIAAARMSHPFLLDKTAAELIDLLKAEEDRQRGGGEQEQEQVEADAAASTS